MSFLSSAVRTLLVFFATAVLLFVPDIVFRLAGYGIISMDNTDSIATVIVLAAILTLMRSWPGRFGLAALLMISEILWLGSLRFFGDVLRPAQILLITQEQADITLGIWDGLMILLPSTLMVAGVFLVLVAVQSRRVHRRTLHVPALGIVASIVAVGGIGFLLAGPSDRALYDFPGLQTASAVATYRASIVAGRYAFFSETRVPDGLTATAPTVTSVPIENDDEPTTVVVVMGESINASELSIFGATPDTTPNLKSWLTAPPAGLTMTAHVGFSGGVATLASVPTFLRPSAVPIGIASRGPNLFDVARAGGFKSWLFSAQRLKLLAAADGAPGAERIASEDTMEDEYARTKDGYLADLVRSVPEDYARRQFFFLHQRAAHSPYRSNCVDPADADWLSDAGAGDRRETDYKAGARCWDKNVAAIVSAVAARKGNLYIFVTADHSELVGEDGYYGHGHPVLRNAVVPFILLTNRPQSRVAEAFRSMAPESFFNLSRVVALALGSKLEATNAVPHRVVINFTLPYGGAGSMQIDEIAPWTFATRSFGRDGRLQSEKTVDLSDFGVGDAFAQDVQAGRR